MDSRPSVPNGMGLLAVLLVLPFLATLTLAACVDGDGALGDPLLHRCNRSSVVTT